MSEKLYALLLRLYPARFRSRYAGEAMQLFRDRLREERGLRKRTRLWLDVLFDVFLSAPREHSRPPARPAPASGGFPSFLVLEEEPLRADKFLIATLLALLAVATFGYLLTHGGNRVFFAGMSGESLRSAMAPAANATTAHQDSSASAGGAAEPVPLVTAAERALVIRRVLAVLRQYDPSPAESRSVAEFLQQQQTLGTYSGIVKGPDFAALLTAQIRGLTQHVQVTVLCGQEPAATSSMWIVPHRPGARLWQRIDPHFSVDLVPVA